MANLRTLTEHQGSRNEALLKHVEFLGDRIASQVLPLHLDVAQNEALSDDVEQALTGLQIEAAQTAVRSLASLAEIGELDHLGGGLELIPGLLMTLAVTDYERVYTPRRGWNLRLNGQNLRYHDGFEAKLQASDRVALFPPGR